MNQTELDTAFHEMAATVVHHLLQDELNSTFRNFSDFLEDRVQEMPAWQIALPVICCLASDGSQEDGISVASAWTLLYLASETMDQVEDQEFTPDPFAHSPEAATNLATSLIFAAFHILPSIKNTHRTGLITQIFSSAGFDASIGQHQDLMKPQSSVEETLNKYWEILILKSGSVFRAATAGGAAAGIVDEAIVEALGDYGTAIGVMLQLIDDCRDAFHSSQEIIHWEISLPLLLYLMTVGEEKIIFPAVRTRAEWVELLKKSGVIHAVSSLLLEWKTRALNSLEALPESREKLILARIPTLFLERIASLQ